MKRIFSLFTLVAMTTIVTATPALANHTEVDHYYDDGHNLAATWSNSGTEDYCIDPNFPAQESDSAVLNIRQSITLAFEQWKDNTDFNRSFNDTGICPGQASFTQAWEDAGNTRAVFLGENQQEEFCQNYLVNSASRVEYEDLGWIAGQTIVCDRDENGLIDFFVVIIDTNSEWYWPESGDPTATYTWSFRSIMTHEAGHVTGWDEVHLPNITETCPNNASGHNTMCNDEWGAFYGAGGNADMTLESHDIGEINQAY
jgi:hypothetical protein